MILFLKKQLNELPASIPVQPVNGKLQQGKIQQGGVTQEGKAQGRPLFSLHIFNIL